MINCFQRCFWGCFLYYVPSPTYDLSKLVKHDVQLVLSDAMDDPDCGVYVHWGIKGSGKTAYATYLAHQLKERGRHVLLLDSDSVLQPISATAIRKFCDVLPARKRLFSLNPLEPPPTTIIIDDFDKDWDDNDTRRCNMIKTFAKRSRMSKRFNILLLLSSAQCAKTVIEWDWTRIKLTSDCGKWDEAHVAELLSMYPHVIAADDYEERLRLCILAGTPGFVVWSEKESTTRMKTRAEKTAKEWRDGWLLLTTD